MDITEVKARLRWKGTQYDEYLSYAIPDFIAKVKTYTNNQFLNEDGIEELPPDVRHTIAKWIQWDVNNESGLESETFGEVSRNYSNEIPQFVKQDLKPHRKVRFV